MEDMLVSCHCHHLEIIIKNQAIRKSLNEEYQGRTFREHSLN
jgi:hypothetical protein